MFRGLGLRVFLSRFPVLACLAFALAPLNSLAQQPSLPSRLPVGTNFPNSKPLDILGVFPGMALAQAEPIVKREADKFFGFRKFANVVNYPWFITGGDRYQRGAPPQDNVAAWISSPVAGAEVIAVERNLHFENDGQSPSTTSFIDALVAKYGKPFKAPTPQEVTSTVKNAYVRLAWRFKNGQSAAPDEVCDVNNIGFNSPDLESLGYRANTQVAYTQGKLKEWMQQFFDNAYPRGNCGILLAAFLQLSDVPDRMTRASIKMIDYSRINRMAEIEAAQRKSDEEARLRSRQQTPAAGVPKL